MTIRTNADLFYYFIKWWPFFFAYTCFIIIILYYRHLTGNVCCIYSNHPNCKRKTHGRRWSYNYIKTRDTQLRNRNNNNDNSETDKCEYLFDRYNLAYIGIIGAVFGLLLIVSIVAKLFPKFDDQNKFWLICGLILSLGYMFALMGIIITMSYNYIYTEEKNKKNNKNNKDNDKKNNKNENDIREGFVNKIRFITFGTMIYGFIMNFLKIKKMYSSLKRQANVKERGSHIAIVLGAIVMLGTVINIFIRGQQTKTNEMDEGEVNNSFATSYYIIFFALTVGGFVMFYTGILGNIQMFVYYGLVYLLSWGLIEYYRKQKQNF